MKPTRRILHIDMDCFFAAIEIRDNPALAGRPVIVGAMPGTRGVISACNYEARKFGLHSAMPISRAFKLCPKGAYLKPDMDKYEHESDRVMAILARFTDRIETISVDEAFMDITDLGSLFGPPETIGRSIKSAIRTELMLTASVGVAQNKFMAKIASDLRKPDGLLIVTPEETRAFLDPLPVGRLPGVGAKTLEILHRMRILTVGELHRTPERSLRSRFGENGAADLKTLAQGIGHNDIITEHDAKSMSREHTYQEDTADRALLHTTLLELTEEVARRLRSHGLRGRTVHLTWRGTDFTRHTRQRTLPSPTDVSDEIFRVTEELFRANIARDYRVRLIGMGMTGFDPDPAELQTSLFESPAAKTSEKKSRLEKAKDSIRDRFGDHAIRRASLIE